MILKNFSISGNFEDGSTILSIDQQSSGRLETSETVLTITIKNK